MELSMSQKHAITSKTASRYRRSSKSEKKYILDEFTKTTGYNRKYAIHLLAHWGIKRILTIEGKPIALRAGRANRKNMAASRGRPRRYTDATVESLKKVWDFFDYRCGKLLAPLLRLHMDHIARVEKFEITHSVREQLLAISPATIDRVLTPERKKLQIKGRSHTKAGALLKHQIPIRVFFDWNERIPGFFELDTVAHDGGSASGEYLFTLNATDVSSGWVELRALLNKAQRWVKEGVEDINDSLPFSLKGVDSDNGGEFINKQLLNWCHDNTVDFTRGRPYKKNDNCFVEQKNGDVVRKYVGYYRFDTTDEYEALKDVYAYLCPLMNYFYPSLKLISKTRIGAKVKKHYDPPKTPFTRILAALDPDDPARKVLIDRASKLNLIELKISLDAALDTLMQAYKQKNRQ